MSAWQTFALDADGKVRVRGVAFEPRLGICAEAMDLDYARRGWTMRGALIVCSTIAPETVFSTLRAELFKPLPRGLLRDLTGFERDDWSAPQPPARLTGGVGPTRPEPF